MGRMHWLDAQVKCFFSSIATGILLFLLWDVLTAAVDPVETALNDGRGGRFAWLATLLAVGFAVGLLSLVAYDGWMKRRRRKAFVSAGAAAATDWKHATPLVILVGLLLRFATDSIPLAHRA